MGGDAKVSEQVADIIKELEQHLVLVKEQSATLEASLAQIDRYQQVGTRNQGKLVFSLLSYQEIQQLRQQIINVEQQLRVVMAPTYLPHNRERALEEQNVSGIEVQIFFYYILIAKV
jgi:nesprin-1